MEFLFVCLFLSKPNSVQGLLPALCLRLLAEVLRGPCCVRRAKQEGHMAKQAP